MRMAPHILCQYTGEPMTMVGVLFLGVLIAGIVGLNFLEGGSEKEDAS